MKKYGMDFEGVPFQMSAKRLGRGLEASRLLIELFLVLYNLTNFQKFCTCPVMFGLCYFLRMRFFAKIRDSCHSLNHFSVTEVLFAAKLVCLFLKYLAFHFTNSILLERRWGQSCTIFMSCWVPAVFVSWTLNRCHHLRMSKCLRKALISYWSHLHVCF